jgi:transposase
VNLKQLQSLEESIQAITVKIVQEAIGRPDVKLLMRFTGIDYYGAMLLINEMGPITRFASAKKLVSYAGLAPLPIRSLMRYMSSPFCLSAPLDSANAPATSPRKQVV